MARLLLLNGPNLNLLGTREPALYGAATLASIEQRAVALAKELGHELATFQSNAEHELIGRIHQAGRDGVGFIIFNPAGFTHTSVALRDAIAGAGIPVVEVHLTNTAARESFRHGSLTAGAAVGVVQGFGADSYLLGLRALAGHLAHATA